MSLEKVNIEDLDIIISDNTASGINRMADKFYSDPENERLFQEFMAKENLTSRAG